MNEIIQEWVLTREKQAFFLSLGSTNRKGKTKQREKLTLPGVCRCRKDCFNHVQSTERLEEKNQKTEGLVYNKETMDTFSKMFQLTGNEESQIARK